MRGSDARNGSLFSYVDVESRVPVNHPLRVIADDVLAGMSKRFDTAYAPIGRPSIAPEKLLRALLLQALYTIHPDSCPSLRCVENGLEKRRDSSGLWAV